MLPLNTFFWMLVVMFGVIGALRGWVRELLVTFAIIAAYFLRWLLLTVVPYVKDYLVSRTPLEHFYIFGALFVLMTIFGYAGPVVSSYLAGKGRREKIQDILLGSVVGAVNGYLLVGTIWGLLHAAGYGIWGIQAPSEAIAQFAVTFLPTAWMSNTLVLILTGLTMIIVLVVLL